MSISLPNLYVTQISNLIEQRTGLASGVLSPPHLETTLRDLSKGNLPGLVDELQSESEFEPTWQRLFRSLVIGETYFFRNRAHFDLLRASLLPDIITRRRSHNTLQLNIWSAGCSTGEEAYSIAITVQELVGDLTRWNFRLVGTDMNRSALDTAERAIYRNWSFRHTDDAFQKAYFTPLANALQVNQAIRERVVFRQSNLLDGPPMPQCDVIFCCNVLLYFADEYIRRVEDLLFNALAPGGWLVLGPAEALRFSRERWTTHIFPGTVVYQKPVAHDTTTLYYDRPALKKSAPLTTAPNTTIRPLYEQAVQAVRTKHYDDARRLLDNLVTQNPNDVAAWVLLGCVFANRGALPEAYAQVETALSLDAMHADAHYLKGVFLFEERKFDAARDALRAALYCQRGHPLAGMILGQIYARNVEIEKARRLWAETIKLLDKLPLDMPVSDLSDLTARNVRDFLQKNLKEIN